MAGGPSDRRSGATPSVDTAELLAQIDRDAPTAADPSPLPPRAWAQGGSARARESSRGFGRVLGASLIVHGIAFGGLLLAGSWGARRSLEIEAMPVELVTLGAPRDPKLLPRKTSGGAPPPSTRTSREAPSPDAVALDARSKDEKSPTKTGAEPKLSDAARRLLDAPDRDLDQALAKLETPEGRPDGSRFGTTTSAQNSATEYEARIQAVLKSRYQVPLTIPDAQRRFLQAEVELFIDGRGRVTRYEFISRHPNQAFMSALEALLRAVELPPPPPTLARQYATQGVTIRFKP